MLIVETVTACIPAYVAAAIFARTWWHKRKHARCLANIRRLEGELGLGPAVLRGGRNTPKSAAQRWAENVGTAQPSYGEMLLTATQKISAYQRGFITRHDL